MNKYLLSLALVAIIAMPTWAGAQTLIDTTAATGISNTIDAVPATVPMNIREKIRADLNTGKQNSQYNQETRNALMNKQPNSSVQPRLMATSSGQRVENRAEYRIETMEKRPIPASSTEARREDRRENIELRQEQISKIKERLAPLEQFRVRKDHIIRQMNTALGNLSQIRDRINSRIDKEKANGRDMTTAIAALATADSKIAIAKQSVISLEALAPLSATSTASTTQYENIRKAVQEAEKNIREARKALNDTVITIARAMGLKVGQDGKIAPVTTASPAAVEAI